MKFLNGLNLGGGWCFFYCGPKLREVGLSFISWSMLYRKGWSPRSSYFIGVAYQQLIMILTTYIFLLQKMCV